MKCIHETIIKDIVDVAKDFKDSVFMYFSKPSTSPNAGMSEN